MKKSHLIILIITFLVGAFLRFYPNNWDIGQHLHPDERFLTMVGNQMEIPKSFSQYLDPSLSRFNPGNLGFDFFVYGVFPLSLTKIFAVALHMDTYQGFTLLGRTFSAICDVFIIFLVYKISELFTRRYHFSKRLPLVSAIFYSSFVLPIQLSHFFTVDMFLSFFVTASIYFLLNFYETRKIYNLIFCSFFWGLGIASKISAIYVLPLILIVLLMTSFPIRNHAELTKRNILELIRSIRVNFGKKILRFGIYLIIFLVVSYIAIKLFDPYLFASGRIYDPRISPDFLQDIKTLKTFDNPDAWFPPAVQWITKPPIFFALYNLSIFGVGIFSFALIILGGGLILRKYRYFEILALFFWIVIFFFYQSSQFSKTMRYFIFIYPILAVFAGFGFNSVYQKLPKPLSYLLLLVCSIWSLAFYSIYIKPETRVSASHFIYNTIPREKILLVEHWDDPLPLPVDDPMKKNYKIEQLPVFDPDNDEKWKKMDDLLNEGDFLILSSNRGWGSILSVPKRYPRMSAYYQKLLANKNPQYELIKTFSSYPSLKYLGIPITIPDDFADESFTVYDHPKVMIFQKRY